MKLGFEKKKKFRYGSVSVALTALVIAAVIIFNAIFTTLSNKYLWHLDLTKEKLYTITDECESLLRDELAKIDAKRRESDKNNVSINDEKNKANAQVIAENEAIVSASGKAEITSIWTDVSELWTKIGAKATELEGVSGEKARNEVIDALNTDLITLNKNIDRINENINILNKDIKEQNNKLGLSEGDAAYTAPLENIDNLANYVRVNGDLKVTILFCEEPDNIEENAYSRFIWDNAKQLQQMFPDIITVEYVDIWTNPSAVQKYKLSSYDTIRSTDVIVTSGTEFRVHTLEDFYAFSNGETEPWAYLGEKKLAASILAVTRAESPIACLTYNHGEKVSYDLYYLLEDVGYEVVLLDLLNEEIPENCRLILSCDPVQDFFHFDPNDPEASTYKPSEITKLAKFLDESNSFMAFIDPDTKKLPNLELYLEQWGVVIDRHQDETSGTEFNYLIKETGANTITTDGFTIFGQYAKNGLGNTMTLDFTESENAPKVIFKNSASLSVSPSYKMFHEEDDTEYGTTENDFALYTGKDATRKRYALFTSSSEAIALANGRQVDKASAYDPFTLMTITREEKIINETDYSTVHDPANVVVCASTEIYAEKYLSSSVYGNSEVLMTVFNYLSREVSPVDLDLKVFSMTQISTMTPRAATTWTLCLALIPTVAVFALGTFVIIRRKYS